MRSVLTKLDKLNSQLIPNDNDLWRAQVAASDKPTQEEMDAYLAQVYGRSTPEQDAIMEAWFDNNLLAVATVWDARFPRWREGIDEPDEEREYNRKIAEQAGFVVIEKD